MDNRNVTPSPDATGRPEPGDDTPGRRFAYEMAFQPKFQGRRWDEVDRELRDSYPGWRKAHGLDARPGTAWDDVKRQVREAWDAALDVQHAEANPWTGQWDERADEYRSFWEGRYTAVPGRRWEDDAIGYRYFDSMAMDPRFVGRPWEDVAPGLQAGFPAWAASHGYRITEGESAWERFRDLIRDAWENMKHRRSA